jgi:hypothetical protein
VHADQPSDLPVRQALGGQQHDLGAGGVALRGGVRADASPQLGTLGIGQGQRRQARHLGLLVSRSAKSSTIPTELLRGCTISVVC